MFLLINILFRIVKAFLPRSKYLLISWLQSPSAVILEPKKIKSVTVSIVSNSICHEVIGLDEAQAGIKIAGRSINNLRYADNTTLIAESEEELKSLLMRVKEDSETAGLKVDIQKTRITASGPITSWQTNGEKLKTVTGCNFLGSKITADGDCSHEIERHLLLGREVMTNIDSILKSRDITFLTKIRLVRAMVFPLVMYGCESWTINKAERQRIDAFEMGSWRRPLSVPWTAR